MAIYRGYTTTQEKIQAIATIRITKKSEAIAFLRAISNVNMQIADILQRQEIAAVSARNQTIKPIEEAKKVQETTSEPEQLDLPISFDDEEVHTEEQKESRLSKLKKATSK